MSLIGCRLGSILTMWQRCVRRAARPIPTSLPRRKPVWRAGRRGSPFTFAKIAAHSRSRRLRPARVPGVRLNLEMAVVPEIVAIARDVRPDESCLVPERRHELTTEGGLDVAGQAAAVRDTVAALAQAGIVVSLFIDPDPRQIEAAAAAGRRSSNCIPGASATPPRRALPSNWSAWSKARVWRTGVDSR